MSEREHETTPQTLEALRPIVKSYAYERGVSEQYVNALLAGLKLDEYYRFKHKLFRPVLRASLDSARVYVEDLQAELDRHERVKFSKGIDHGLVVDSMLKYVASAAGNTPKAERVQLLRKAHRMIGVYLRSVEFEEEAPEGESFPAAVNQ